MRHARREETFRPRDSLDLERDMAYTYRQVRASYGGAKQQQERHDIMFRWFARPLSFPVAWVALQLGLVPNHVTYLSLAGNIAGLALMASGSREWMAGGVVLLLVSLVLDAADGNMARTMQRFSPFGQVRASSPLARSEQGFGEGRHFHDPAGDVERCRVLRRTCPAGCTRTGF